MGDSCFNEGMKQITEVVGNVTGSYAKCVPTGNVLTDTTNGFLMTMDKNVDVFAENIRKNPEFRDAPFINCVGFSQVWFGRWCMYVCCVYVCMYVVCTLYAMTWADGWMDG